MAGYLTEDIVSSAKRSEWFPLSQTTLVDPDDLIALANEEFQTKLVPAIMSVREDFFLATKQVNIQANLPNYTLPERAIGNAFKDLLYMPNASDQAAKYPLPKTTIHDVQTWSAGAAVPGQFYMQGDQVVLNPTPSATVGALLFYFYARPNKIVPTSSVAKITGISVGVSQTTLTVNTDLTALATPVGVGSLVDLLRAKSPFALYNMDVSVQAITSTTITLNNTDVQDVVGNLLLQVGDYICPAQTANIPMVPQEFHPILGEMVAYRALKGVGHKDQMMACAANITEMMKNAFKLIGMRVEQEQDIIFERWGILGAISAPNFAFATKF